MKIILNTKRGNHGSHPVQRNNNLHQRNYGLQHQAQLEPNDNYNGQINLNHNAKMNSNVKVDMTIEGGTNGNLKFNIHFNTATTKRNKEFNMEINGRYVQR